MGLVGTLARDSSKVYLNEQETRQLDSKYDSRNYYWQKIIDVYVANGFADMQKHPCRVIPLISMV